MRKYIQVNENYRITSDKWNIILQKRRFKKDNKTELWDNFLYASSFKDALKSMVKCDIKQIDDIQMIVDKIDELHKNIDDLKVIVI